MTKITEINTKFEISFSFRGKKYTLLKLEVHRQKED